LPIKVPPGAAQFLPPADEMSAASEIVGTCLQKKRKLSLESKSKKAASGLASLSEIAFDNDMKFMTGVFEQDHSLAFTVAALMREGTLKTLLEQSDSPPKAKFGSKKLSQALKKVKNFKANAKLMVSVLSACEPEALTADELRSAMSANLSAAKMIQVLCFALNANLETKLPVANMMYEQELVEACVARYNAMGTRLKEYKATNLDSFTGYFKFDPKDMKVTCTLDSEMSYKVTAVEGAKFELADNHVHAAMLKCPRKHVYIPLVEEMGLTLPSESEWGNGSSEVGSGRSDASSVASKITGPAGHGIQDEAEEQALPTATPAGTGDAVL
jgi:hypothetical protein